MESSNSTKRQKIIASFIVIVAIAMLAAGTYALQANQKSSESTSLYQEAGAGEMQSQQVSPQSNQATQSSNANPTHTYKDGTYSAQSEYSVPRSYESIKVTVTIKNDVVTDSKIVNSEGDHESASYQERFASEYKSYVVGKKIGDIELSYVAGASDTTEGFNDAIKKIAQQAASQG